MTCCSSWVSRPPGAGVQHCEAPTFNTHAGAGMLAACCDKQERLECRLLHRGSFAACLLLLLAHQVSL